MSGVGGLELDRHELLWVFEECGVDRWPFPLRPVHWAAETVEETALHRGRVEERLRARGLLEPAAARMLMAAGQVCATWTLAADLVLADRRRPRAAVVLADRSGAWLLASSEHAGAPVRLHACDPSAVPEVLLGLVGPGRPGRDGPWTVHATPAAPDHPHTRRRAEAAGVAAELVATATGYGVVGAARREPAPAPGPPRRGPRVVSWLDGPRGRYRLVPPAPGGPAVLDPTNDTHLAAEVRTVLAEAADRGRSSA